jgi:protein TonB
MLNLRLEETVIVICFTVLHLGLYHSISHLQSEKPNPTPILIELIHPPKPKPELQEKPKEQPKPKLIDAPPKPKEPPKPAKEIKPKKVLKKPEVKKVVFKPKWQQTSIVKVYAEEVVEKDVVEHTQQLTEPDVKKPENKPEVAETAEPPHTPVITKVTGIGSCSSTLNNYPSEAKEQGLEGTVKVKVQVSADGSVTAASIAKSSGHSILDESVLANVYDCHFEAAEKDGVPIASKVVIPVRFKLD